MRYLCCVLMFWQTMALAAEPKLEPQLELFRPYLNQVWQGQLSSAAEKPQQDIALWQRALNGTAIKMTHSINDGEYGGETMVFWDKSANSLVYYYFTTTGFYTHGTMWFDQVTKELVAEEVVENNSNGITKVRSRSLLQHQQLTTSAEYFKQGKWQPGHRVTYLPQPNAKVIFQ